MKHADLARKAQELLAGENRNTNPIKLGVYRHYKGNKYEVVGFARHSETLEDMVIYQALYGDGETWVRPLYIWSESVDIDGRIVKRFEYVGEHE